MIFGAYDSYPSEKDSKFAIALLRLASNGDTVETRILI